MLMTTPKESADAVPDGRWGGLLLSFGVTALAAALGAAASVNARAFYEVLLKPSWAPPPGVFGPTWTVLYACMAVAAWLVWRAGGPGAAKSPLALYVVQLALNALWSWLFFGWHLGSWAVLEIVALWFILLLTLVSFWRARPVAGLLLLPYWAWVTFAMGLTVAVWRRNPDLL